MSITVTDENGDEYEAYVRVTGGMIDAIVRATDEATWVQGAVFYGLLVPADGDVVLAPGVEISIIGPSVLAPATYSESGEVLTEAVVDSRHHVNLRIHGPALEKTDETGVPKWVRMVISWTKFGEAGGVSNADEKSVELYGVELIDHDTISTPDRVWL